MAGKAAKKKHSSFLGLLVDYEESLCEYCPIAFTFSFIFFHPLIIREFIKETCSIEDLSRNV